jgi:hypothetical protein
LSAYGKYLATQNEADLKEGLRILKAYHQTNSDRDKDKQMESVLQEIAERSQLPVANWKEFGF